MKIDRPTPKQLLELREDALEPPLRARITPYPLLNDFAIIR